MQDESGKDLLLSRTTWGLIFVFVAPMLQKHGVTFADQSQFVDTALLLIGVALAVWGQVKRSKRITSIFWFYKVNKPKQIDQPTP